MWIRVSLSLLSCSHTSSFPICYHPANIIHSFTLDVPDHPSFLRTICIYHRFRLTWLSGSYFCKYPLDILELHIESGAFELHFTTFLQYDDSHSFLIRGQRFRLCYRRRRYSRMCDRQQADWIPTWQEGSSHRGSHRVLEHDFQYADVRYRLVPVTSITIKSWIWKSG